MIAIYFDLNMLKKYSEPVHSELTKILEDKDIYLNSSEIRQVFQALFSYSSPIRLCKAAL